MFGIGGFELFLILIFGFLIFGPDKLPAMAKTLGRAIAKFRNAQEDMAEQLKNRSFIDKESDSPFKNPLEVIEAAADDAKAGAETARERADAVTESVTQHTESFAERKARYDAERAKRKQAEKEAAAEQARIEKRENPKTDVAIKAPAEDADDSREASNRAQGGDR